MQSLPPIRHILLGDRTGFNLDPIPARLFCRRQRAGEQTAYACRAPCDLGRPRRRSSTWSTACNRLPRMRRPDAGPRQDFFVVNSSVLIRSGKRPFLKLSAIGRRDIERVGHPDRVSCLAARQTPARHRKGKRSPRAGAAHKRCDERRRPRRRQETPRIHEGRRGCPGVAISKRQIPGRPGRRGAKKQFHSDHPRPAIDISAVCQL